MSPNPGHVSCACVIADKNCAVEGLINSLHHHQWSRPGTNDRDVLWKLFDQEVLTIAMRITNDDLSCACLESGVNSRFYLFGHELAKAIVLEALRAELIASNNSHHSFHVGRNIDFQLPGLRRCGQSRHGK